EARSQLDSLGAVNTQITVTSDLDEFSISALSASPVDAFGVGTSVVTGSGSPAAGMVYKLVAHRDDAGEWVPVAKTSPAKISVGGRKRAVRRLDAAGIARAEVILIGEDPADTTPPAEPSGRDRVLLVPLITDGVIDERYLGAAGTTRARLHHASVMQELPIEAFRLGRGDPVIPTLYR
ncbi:MAG TPA: nicotinate phosphoribosyltransferase, partial [Cryobacterium sp.]|nr:nicotinate phosphoribosyltransferase [Cryobacterium sp.]